MTDSTSPRRRRGGGGRESRRQARTIQTTTGPAFIKRATPTYELLDDAGLALIEHNADTILEDIGIEFREFPRALELFAKAGAHVDGDRVRFPRGMCREIVQASAPNLFTQHARNPERSVQIGGDAMVLVPAYGPPFVRDLSGERRYATLEDFQNFVKLAYATPSLHHSGGTVCEPVDLPVNKRHLDMIYSHIRFSDKPFMGSVTHPDRAADSVAMAKLVFGDTFVDENCVLINLINANSPLVFDATMLGAAEVYASHNQACVVSPFILAGAMSPVTVAGTCAQILAEALAGIAFTQLVRKGSPVVFGTFASSLSMQSGAPTFGSPEPSLVLHVAAQLARRLGVPFRSGGGLCASKLPDAQAAFEAANTLQAAMTAGVNFMLHTAGWLEGGLVMCYEKFILDADQAGMIGRFCQGVDLSVNGQALDAFNDTPPGQHFLGAAHTQANFENAFYRSEIADNNSFEQWQAEGSTTAAQRANKLARTRLEAYSPPPLDPNIDAALVAFINARKGAEPDKNY